MYMNMIYTIISMGRYYLQHYMQTPTNENLFIDEQ